MITAKKALVIIGISILPLLNISPTLFSQTGHSNTSSENTAPKVFIDCDTCDLDFIHKEIPFVDYVDSPDKAQVYILIKSQKSESGGVKHTISYRGQKEFKGDTDQLVYTAEKDTEESAAKKELTDTIKLGLMRYVGKMPVCDQVSIDFMDEVTPTAVEDKWDFWVFSISANTFLNGEKLYKSGMYHGSVSANRVTPELKISLSVGAMYNTSKFTYGDEVIESSSKSGNIRGLIVKSINDHWSIGAYLSAQTSTYSNINFSIAPAPAIEYNFFPYSESTRRQLRFLYKLSFNPVRYREETIYEKTQESLWKESLSITLEVKQKWGTASTSLTGSHYFHDFQKNRLQLWGDLSLRIIKGLNFNIDLKYSRIHDQLSLPRKEASLEEILLRRQELETTYSYYISIGLSYTFGSTRSNVVNPRFGTGGHGIRISF